MRIFLITGAAIGVVGTLTGFVVGLGSARYRVDPRISLMAYQHGAVLT